MRRAGFEYRGIKRFRPVAYVWPCLAWSENDMPLIFREWRPDAKLARGIWNIPFPEDGVVVQAGVFRRRWSAPVALASLASAMAAAGPDRPLAALARDRMKVRSGHPTGAIPTIYPQPHDHSDGSDRHRVRASRATASVNSPHSSRHALSSRLGWAANYGSKLKARNKCTICGCSG